MVQAMAAPAGGVRRSGPRVPPVRGFRPLAASSSRGPRRPRRRAREDRETAQDCAGAAHAAEAGDFDELSALRPLVEIDDRGEEFSLVGGDAEVGPVDQPACPRHAGVVSPPFVEVHRVVGRTRTFGRDDVEPALSEDHGAVGERHAHAES